MGSKKKFYLVALGLLVLILLTMPVALAQYKDRVSYDINIWTIPPNDRYIYFPAQGSTHQRYEVTVPGYYLVQALGANGGDGTRPISGYSYGGSGAYMEGIIYLNEGDVLYIGVGTKGNNGATSGAGGSGGANGGASGSGYSARAGGGGGGATGVRLGGSSLENRVLVAGGGGGGGGTGSNTTQGRGGIGGDAHGTSDGTLVQISGTNTYYIAGSDGLKGSGTDGSQGRGGTYGAAAGGGAAGISANQGDSSTLGSGGSGGGAGGGGGGGYYGGGGGGSTGSFTSYTPGGGGAGSSFITGDFILAISQEVRDVMADITSGPNYASGSGYCILTYVGDLMIGETPEPSPFAAETMPIADDVAAPDAEADVISGEGDVVEQPQNLPPEGEVEPNATGDDALGSDLPPPDDP